MTLDRAITDVPRWVFLCILAYAPLGYGCAATESIVTFNQFAAVLAIAWAVACLWRRRWPTVSWLVVGPVTLLLLQGWWMAGNAHFTYYYVTWTRLGRVWANPSYPTWPGALDRDLSHDSMLHVTGVLVLFLFACDLMVRPVWRKRVWFTMAMTALAVAVVGTALKLAGPPAWEWFWIMPAIKVEAAFCTYLYHGNAATLMGIGWALALGYMAVAASQKRHSMRQAGWMVVVLGLLVGIFINTSRAGWLLAVILALFVGGRYGWAWWRTAREQFDWRLGLIQGGLLLGVVAVLVVLGLNANWKLNLVRLKTVSKNIEQRYPAQAYEQLAKDTDMLGNGADCFQTALPPYMEMFGMSDEKYGFWGNAHNDYYQYLIEWGWSGSMWWIILILGGLMLGLRDHFRLPMLRDSTQWMLGFCGCAAMVAVLLHARWDFPLEIVSLRLYFFTLLADAWARQSATVEALSLGADAPVPAGHSFSS
jgi:hypothetical protein